MSIQEANLKYLEDALRQGLILRLSSDKKTPGRLTFHFWTNMHGYIETEANAVVIAKLILHSKNHPEARIQNTFLSSEAYQDSLFFPEDQQVLWDPAPRHERKTMTLREWLHRELAAGQGELLTELEAFIQSSGY